MMQSKERNDLKKGITKADIRYLLQQLSGPYWLMGALLYSAGLRPPQCVALRVRDLDLIQQRLQIAEQHSAILAPQLVPHLKLHLSRLRTRHLKALAMGGGWVALPSSPHVSRHWSSQYLFPAPGFVLNSNGLQIRYPFPEARLINAIDCAARSLPIDVGCTAMSAFDLRRALALHLVENGCPVQSMKAYLGLAQDSPSSALWEFNEAALHRVFRDIFSPRLLGQQPHPDFISEPAACYRIAS